MNRIIVFLLFAGAIMALDPPLYPPQFEVKFNETASIGPISGNTTGTIYYDATNNR